MNSYIVVENNNQFINNNYDNNYYNYENKELKLLNLNNVHLFDEDLINNVIMKKINKRFKIILEFIANIYDDDSEGTTPLMQALTETEKFKRELINKERAFLKKEHLELIDKKIKLIENELKEKIYFINLRQRQQEAMVNYMQNDYQEEYDNEYHGKAR